MAWDGEMDYSPEKEFTFTQKRVLTGTEFQLKETLANLRNDIRKLEGILKRIEGKLSE